MKTKRMEIEEGRPKKTKKYIEKKSERRITRNESDGRNGRKKTNRGSKEKHGKTRSPENEMHQQRDDCALART